MLERLVEIFIDASIDHFPFSVYPPQQMFRQEGGTISEVERR